MGEHKVKNIAEPITVCRVRPGSGGTTAIRALVTPALRRRRLAAIAAAVVLPGMRHKLWAGEDEPLRLLCCCAPAYSHEDTVLTE
jgi:hypothetical protein